MANALFTNFAASTLAAGISDVATSCAVQAGDGALFPNPSAGNWFWSILVNASNQYEIVKVTARSTDTFTTITRAQEGTTARAYSAGDRIVHWITAQGLLDLPYLLLAGGTMTGVLVVPDADLHVVGSSDATKIAVLEVDGFTTGATRTLTLPDQSMTVGALARSHLAGLTMSTAGGSGTMSIAAGQAADSTNVAMMTLAAIAKTTSAWAVGTGNGGIDTGAIANSTWYYFWLIMRLDTGVTDVLFSLSATAPTMPANYTLKRRIGAGKTDGSAHWVLFLQQGDQFMWSAPVQDYNNATLGTSVAQVTLASVPSGFRVNALLNALASNAAAGVAAHVYYGDGAAQSASSPSGNNELFVQVAGQSTSGQLNVLTNAAQQVNVVATAANTTLILVTQGWIDRRGRDA